jgi:aconitate hydratase
LQAEVILKVGDNITTDHIMPAGNRVLPLRSNIEAISRWVYHQVEPQFSTEALEKGTVVVVGGENYGQGSSREHAALAPRYLGVSAKIARSYARIHMANLCNFGILPLTFKNSSDYDKLARGMKLVFPGVRDRISRGDTEIPLEAEGVEIITLLKVSPRQRSMLLAGSALNMFRQKVDSKE